VKRGLKSISYSPTSFKPRIGQFTVKLVGLAAVPCAVRKTISPVVAPLGTLVEICVPEPP
jgi:hypothetical protein